MKNSIVCFWLLFVTLFVLFETNAQTRVTPALQEALSKKDQNDFVPVNIHLAAQYDTGELKIKTQHLADRSQRRKLVIDALKDFSKIEQQNISKYLGAMKLEGQVRHIRSLWITNTIHCEATPAVIASLKERTDVAWIDIDTMVQVVPDFNETQYNKIEEGAALDEKNDEVLAGWHIPQVKAHKVWREKGFTGKDIVVAIIDSGVNYNHQDLQGNMWEHPDYPNHGYDFFYNTDNPFDYLYHGTHVAGIVSGNGNAGIHTGIAPKSSIMAVKVINKQGHSGQGIVWEGIEFAVENGADIINLSMGFPYGHPWLDYKIWRNVMDRVMKAGVVVIAAAGNEGELQDDFPTPYNVRIPASIPPPWLHPDQVLIGEPSGVISVGSTDKDDDASAFSSRGPSTWAHIDPYNDYPYDPEMGLIRPDIVAPGEDIVSLFFMEEDAYVSTSGTSMAAPITSGVIALMLEKYPMLMPEDINRILEENAFSLSETKSNIHGSGRVDALNSVKHTPFRGIQYLEYSLNTSCDEHESAITPGTTVSFDMIINNPTEEVFQNTELLMETECQYIVIQEPVVSLDYLAPGDSLLLQQTFSFEVANAIPGHHEILFSLWLPQIAEGDTTFWKAEVRETASAPLIAIEDIEVVNACDKNGQGTLIPDEEAILRVALENQGQLETAPTELFLDIQTPFVQAEDQFVFPGTILPGERAYADFPVRVHRDTEPGLTSSYLFTARSGPYTMEKPFSIKIAQDVETWSTGDFSRFDWSFAGDKDWIIDNTHSYSGTYSARSGVISHNQQSELVLERNVLTNDSIVFNAKISSEEFDLLEFYIDEQRMDRWSGKKDWQRISFPVAAGERTFRWVYIKDPWVSQGDDCAWIDHIELPTLATTWAFAGFDQHAEDLEAIQLQGYASRFNAIQWTTNGSGYFQDNTAITTKYFPHENDLEDGLIEITLTAMYNDKQASHTMAVYYNDCVAVSPYLSDNDDMAIIPNPASIQTSVNFHSSSHKDAIVTVFDITGRIVRTIKGGSINGVVSFELDVHDLQRGIYIVHLQTCSINTSRRLIVQ